MSHTHEDLLSSIQRHEATVAIIGLGYVGLPLALSFAHKGFSVLGLDVDPKKIDALTRGDCYIEHIDPARVRTAVIEGKLKPTSDFARLEQADAIVICVPTPLSPQRDPDMSFVLQTTERIRDSLRRGQLIVLESTTYPGTTDALVRDTLEQTGFRCGSDFYLAFSPEREDPGNKEFSTTTIPKVIGGVDSVSGDLAQALYSEVVAQTVRVSHARVAEASKLTENIFRAVNIALVNELKVIYERMGIDVWEVLDAASTKPFGFMRFNPGPGWGGHCIPLDPFYLAWKAREHHVDTKFIELAGEINRAMPSYVVHRLQQALNERSLPVRNSSILILGLAYKKDVGDVRESPAFEVIRMLLELGANVTYHDPHVPILPMTREWGHLPTLESRPLNEEELSRYTATVIVTDHSAVDYALVAKHARLIVDTRGIYRAPQPHIVKA